ncbi:unnamed protein product, partial [Laminaria digitata]
MIQGLGLPLARAFCAVVPRQGGAYGRAAAHSSCRQQQHLVSLVSNDPKTNSQEEGVAKRPASGRVCMSSEAKADAPPKMEEEIDPGVVEGTDLRVLKYPHPALRAENAEIEVFDDDLKKLAKDMLKVMYAAKGVGLAAPQVGVNKRLMVFNPEGDAGHWLDEIVLVNPQIVATGKGKITDEEGCLSFPGMGGQVEALNARGKKVKKKYTDWTARIFQ